MVVGVGPAVVTGGKAVVTGGGTGSPATSEGLFVNVSRAATPRTATVANMASAMAGPLHRARSGAPDGG